MREGGMFGEVRDVDRVADFLSGFWKRERETSATVARCQESSKEGVLVMAETGDW